MLPLPPPTSLSLPLAARRAETLLDRLIIVLASLGANCRFAGLQRSFASSRTPKVSRASDTSLYVGINNHF